MNARDLSREAIDPASVGKRTAEDVVGDLERLQAVPFVPRERGVRVDRMRTRGHAPREDCHGAWKTAGHAGRGCMSRMSAINGSCE